MYYEELRGAFLLGGGVGWFLGVVFVVIVMVLARKIDREDQNDRGDM